MADASTARSALAEPASEHGCSQRSRGRGCRRGSAASMSAGGPSSATRSPCSGSPSSSRCSFARLFADLLATHSPYTGGDLRTERLLPPGPDVLARHRRPGARHLFAHRLRLAPDAARRHPGRRHRDPDRPRGRHRRRLFRRLDRRRPDAAHRHLPRLPAADPGARLRRRARPGHRERDHRHRHHRLAALCPHRPRRDADDPQLATSSRRCGCRAGRRRASSCAMSCRSASPR